MKKKGSLVMRVVLIIVSVMVFSATAHAEWANVYGGAYQDAATSIQQTSDGGYIVTGTTDLNGSGPSDIRVLKLNPEVGTIAWQKTYGGGGSDSAASIQQTSDGGYILAGETASFGTGSGYNIWVLKLNSDGTIAWQKTYGSGFARYIRQTSDGGYIVAGKSGYKAFVIRLNPYGGIAWRRYYSGDINSMAWSVQETSALICWLDSKGGGYRCFNNPDGYIVGGYTGGGTTTTDFWVLRLTLDGTIVWQRKYGTGNNREDIAYSIQQTSNGYIVAGKTSYPFTVGADDIWVLKLNSSGNVTWQKTYNRVGYSDIAYSIQQARDGGYIVGGLSGGDALALKLNSDGTIAWQKTYNGVGADAVNSIRQTSDGGYVAAGVTGWAGPGTGDFLVLKLNANGGINGCSNLGISNLSAANTSVTGINTSATVESPILSLIITTAAIVTNTEVGMAQVCYY